MSFPSGRSTRLPEPIHLDLVLEDERVVDVIPSIGYIHRGFEKLVEKREFTEYVYIAERTCGICSFIHGMTYCQGVEKIMNIDVPERAVFLRTIWSEYSRLHSHLLWLGLFADSFGFENLFMNAWRIRERILDVMEQTTGAGHPGVLQDRRGETNISGDKLDGMRKDLDSVQKEIEELTNVFLRGRLDQAPHKRRGGALKRGCIPSGAVGPTARASGVDIDLRKTGYAADGG